MGVVGALGGQHWSSEKLEEFLYHKNSLCVLPFLHTPWHRTFPCCGSPPTPPEIRDTIYRAYLLVDDGYVYSFDRNKLRVSDGRPIELSLAYTCRLVAAEMSGLALRVNTVNFRTASTESMRTGLCRFEYLLRYLREQNQELINRTASKMSPEMIDKISEDYPDFYPLFDGGYGASGGRAMTTRLFGATVVCKMF